MDVTGIVQNSSQLVNSFSESIKRQQETKAALSRYTKSKSEQQSPKKKSKVGSIFVSGHLSKEKLRSIKLKLRKKISETLASEDNDAVKKLKALSLQRQVESIDRIIRQIDERKQERKQEQVQKLKQDKTSQSKTKRKRKSGETLWIKKEDLELKKTDPAAGLSKSVESTTSVTQIDTVSSPISTNEAVISESSVVDIIL